MLNRTSVATIYTIQETCVFGALLLVKIMP